MGKLHEILAVEGDLKGVFGKILNETTITFTKKEDHFFGFNRRLDMFDENAPDQIEDNKEMTTTVGDKLDYQKKHVVRYLDAVLRKEKTNQVASADIVIDGETIAENVPATFLLGLESKLKTIRACYETIPTLPPGIKWQKDPQKGDGVYSRVHPEETFKTEKVFKVQVLYEATKEHPAQVEKIQETRNIGKYVKNTWSGMLTPHEKSILLERLDKLMYAVKKARQRANSTKIIKVEIGDKLFDYISSY